VISAQASGLHSQLPSFHVGDARNGSKRAKLNSRGESGEWLNEIHPGKVG
jgi:hypothetical protein